MKTPDFFDLVCSNVLTGCLAVLLSIAFVKSGSCGKREELDTDKRWDAQIIFDSNIVARVKELQIEVLGMQQEVKAQAHVIALGVRNNDALIGLVSKVVDRVKELERTSLRVE